MNDLEQMGIVIRGGRAYWGWKHSSLRWAPRWVRRFIVHSWNCAACRILGHGTVFDYRAVEELDPQSPDYQQIVCTDCCARLTPEEYEALRARRIQ